MPSTCSEGPAPPSRRAGARRAGALALFAAAVTGCSFAPAPRHPRPALPLPEEVADRFALPAPPVVEEVTPVDDHGTNRGTLTCGDETIRFHLHRADLPGRPLVLLVPILAGGEDLMRTIARKLVHRGYHAAWCDRVASALRPPQRGPDLETLFRRTVLHQRALLDFLRSRSEPQPVAIFALGISMGGMVATVLAAVEPGLCGTAVCLSGGDLPSILLDSDEQRIVSWRRWRLAEDGLAGRPLAIELRRALSSDPALLAPFVATERVFLVATAFDAVVRPCHQDRLWEALGRPERLTVPLGHYSAGLVLDPILTAVTGFYSRRLREDAWPGRSREPLAGGPRPR